MKLLAECLLVFLWFWKFLGTWGSGSSCRQLPAFSQCSGSFSDPKCARDLMILAPQ